MADLISSQIYLSRDRIRQLVTDEVRSYLELENVDLTKSSFLSYIIDIISTLTGNLMFYQLSTYREFFLTKAQLPESILNLSAFLGYNTSEAKYSTANVLMTIPFGFDDSSVQFNLPTSFKLNTSDSIEFRTYYTTYVTVTNNSIANVYVLEGNKRYNLPVDFTTTGFSFVLPMRQYKQVIQEFQIDEDLQTYQFVTLDVPINGKVSSLIVQVREPGSSGYTTWSEYPSAFLMSNTDEGYVSRRTDVGRRLTFGNDLIGVQPKPGSTILVTAIVTEGKDGNVIAGTIRDGDRIYITTLAGNREIVQYETVNTSSATGGEDEESLEDIRKNSIDSLTALNRLVSENDYKILNVIMPNANIAQNSLPVLKRSDLKTNEISLFTTLLYGTNAEEIYNLVPMRNATLTIPTSSTTIYRDTVVTIGDYEYYTLFNIDIDALNDVGYYSYIIYEIEMVPALETSYTSTYDIYSDKLEVIKSGNDGIFKLSYKSTAVDSALATCTIANEQTGLLRDMVNDSTSDYFVYTFSPYTNIPLGEQTFTFTIYDPSNEAIAKYANKVTFRSDLKSFMMSNTSIDSTSYIVYDVPVIQKDFYDSIDKRDFELNILQVMLTSLDLNEQRMLTDFTNVKFTNTHGNLVNIQYNPTTRSDVIDIVETEPTSAVLDDRFILVENTQTPGPNQDNLLRCIDDSTAIVFAYEKPSADAVVYVTNRAQKYIYSERGWITMPSYRIPLEIEIEVFRGLDFSGTIGSMTDLVRDTLYAAFKDRFGTNAVIYRSEIIAVVNEIQGVSHCRLRKPETSVFFDFDIDDFTQDELLRYGPEYVYFRKEDISVRVI
jgi:hypothetical protein